MRRSIACLVGCVLGPLSAAVAQCPATNFSAAAAACQQQQITLTNTSAPGSYSWDFCSGDFNQAPTAQFEFALPGVNGRPGIEFVFDSKWFAFVTGTFGNLLYRVEFDNGIQAPPTAITNLGNVGGGVNQPGQVRIVKEGSQWYGILHNTGGDVVKLTFGTALTNTPTASTLISGIGYGNSGLAIGKDVVDGYIAVITQASGITVIRLGNLLSNPDPITDVTISGAIPFANSLGDVDVINVCGHWYGVANNLGDGSIFRLDFGTSLFSVPSTQVQAVGVSNPGRIRIAREGVNYFFLMMSLDGILVKGSYGSSISSTPTITLEGSLGGALPTNMYGLAMVKENSSWNILGVSLADGKAYRVNYTNTCGASPLSSSTNSPLVSYSQAGTYTISLENQTSSGVGVASRSITVSGQVAPDIDFSSLNQCAGSNVDFTSSNVSGNIVNYTWTFGDSQGNGTANPSHIYSTAGNYVPTLVVTASNGCVNTVSHPLTVFNQPVATFNSPVVTPICTNQQYLFTNTSTYDVLSNPTWEWRLNGTLVAGSPDLMTAFSSATSQEVRLKAIIPGCSNEQITNIATVLPGPIVGFAASDDCVSNVLPFTNASTGADAGFSWDFGDGNQSAVTSPTHQYLAPGTYTVSLTGSNIAGCQNVTSVDVEIYSLPQPDFAVGLPPFSCSGTPTPFQNNTPALTDSNLQSWGWNFGDAASSTSTLPQPAFTYTTGASYSVQLTATSDVGCSNTVTKLISIGTSPIADFAFGPACVNQPTLFTDLSTGGVQSRVWQVASSTYSAANPTHSFSNPATYPVSLTVTATGGCTSTKVKSVIVPVLPTLVLQTTNPCAGQLTKFDLTDASNPIVDAVVGWQWNIAGTASTSNPVQQAIGIVGGAPVSVRTTHASGCSYLLSSTVNILAAPTASFTASTDRGEAPLTVQFQNTSIGASQYLWTFSGNTPGSSTSVSPTYTFVDLGDFTAQLTAIQSNGCTDTKILPIQVLVASIDLEVIDFSLSPDPVTQRLKANVTVRNNSNVPVGTVEVALHLSSLIVVDETIAVNLAPGESTTRTLSFAFSPDQLPDGYVCAELISENDVQADNNRKCMALADGDFILPPYPNPSLGPLRIDWISSSTGSARLTIYNSQGRREYEWETPSVAGLNQSQHDLSFLAPGVYFVTVQTPEALQTLRIVRQ